MINGSNFYQVTSTFELENGKDLTIAVGLTNMGKAVISTKKEIGRLALIEDISVKDGQLATAVFANPSQIMSFSTVEKDEVVLILVKSGEPFTYYVEPNGVVIHIFFHLANGMKCLIVSLGKK